MRKRLGREQFGMIVGLPILILLVGGGWVIWRLNAHLDDIDTRTTREGEFICSALLGWNFGDGHLHDERLVAAVQRRLHLAPGDLVVVYCESQPTPWLHRPQEYRVIDAALGVVERGHWNVEDCVREQPWLPNGPVAFTPTWTAPGFDRRVTFGGDAPLAGTGGGPR